MGFPWHGSLVSRWSVQRASVPQYLGNKRQVSCDTDSGVIWHLFCHILVFKSKLECQLKFKRKGPARGLDTPGVMPHWGAIFEDQLSDLKLRIYIKIQREPLCKKKKKEKNIELKEFIDSGSKSE